MDLNRILCEGVKAQGVQCKRSGEIVSILLFSLHLGIRELHFDDLTAHQSWILTVDVGSVERSFNKAGSHLARLGSPAL